MATTNISPPTPVLLSVLDAARALGISRSSLYELLGAGSLASVTIGRRRLIPTVAIDEYVSRLSSGKDHAPDAA